MADSADLHIAKVLSEDPQLAEEFYYAACEVVEDFDDWGPVLQANADGVYDSTTAIGKLRAALDALREIRYRPSSR